jgi:curli biogenesis system outer membrane secretion channel CsgG
MCLEEAMKRAVVLGVMAAALVVLALPAPVRAQGKIRIAIWEFENHSEQSWWFSGDLGPAARNQVDSEFSENPTLSAKFSVIERDKLNLVMKEQGLGATGALDPQSAAKVGRVLGIRYILTGGIDKFAINTTRGAIGAFGVGGNLVQAQATINVRLIDTTTAERIISVSADGEVKKGGGFFKGTSLSRDAEWGVASETIQKTSKALIAKLVSPGYLDKISAAAMPAGGLEGRIIKVDGNRAYVNIGSASGVKVGDKFTVFNIGEALVDPDTGAKLGAEEKQTGSGSVTEVQEKFAIITLTGSARAKDTIRKQ